MSDEFETFNHFIAWLESLETDDNCSGTCLVRETKDGIMEVIPCYDLKDLGHARYKD